MDEEKTQESIDIRLDQQIGLMKPVLEHYNRIGETIEAVTQSSGMLALTNAPTQKIVTNNLARTLSETVDFSAISAIKDSIDTVLNRLKEINPEKYHEENIRDLKERAEKIL